MITIPAWVPLLKQKPIFSDPLGERKRCVLVSMGEGKCPKVFFSFPAYLLIIKD